MLWTYGVPQDLPHAILTLKRAGIKGVGGIRKDAAQALLSAGIGISKTVGAFSRLQGDSEELLCEDVFGEKYIWFSSNCPNAPGVAQRHIQRILAALEDGLCHQVFTDGCRFASPGSGLRAFLGCFCAHCAQRARELGFDIHLMRADTLLLWEDLSRRVPLESLLENLAVDHPGFLQMFAFHREVISRHMQEVKAALRAAHPTATLGMYSFTPAYAGWVGQDYAALARVTVDVFSPMIYRFTENVGIACLPYETRQLCHDLSGFGYTLEEVRRAVLPRLFVHPAEMRRMDGIFESFSVETVGQEVAKARQLIGNVGLMPIVWLADDDLPRVIRTCLDHGAEDVSMFIYNDTRKDPYLALLG